jgi:hypothetical protein
MLLEPLHTAFLCWGKLGLQHFERQSANTATNTPTPIVHIEMNNVAREMMVPWVACGRQKAFARSFELLLHATTALRWFAAA